MSQTSYPTTIAPVQVPKKFRLKPEFVVLFKNVATGREFWLSEAIAAPGTSVRKGRTSTSTQEKGRALLERLAEAGFVDAIEVQAEYVPKP